MESSATRSGHYWGCPWGMAPNPASAGVSLLREGPPSHRAPGSTNPYRYFPQFPSTAMHSPCELHLVSIPKRTAFQWGVKSVQCACAER